MTDPSGSLRFRIDEDERGGRIVAMGEGGEAELTFRRTGEDRITADHTGVPDAMGGKGVGTALVERLHDFALRERLKVVPACPFVAAKMKDHPEWSEVLAS